MSTEATTDRKNRVVIVGAGFGGLAAAHALRRAPAVVTVVDRRNYHLFQPLLYQVATAALSPADVAWPIRRILRDQKNAAVRLSRVTGVDTARQEILIGEERLPYDYLILATGARHAYFGRDEWESVAPGLKKIDDALELRRRILLAFERAETSPDGEMRRQLLTFIVIGGGPTGVEMAGAIAELSRRALVKDFRSIDPNCTRTILIEAGPRLLPSFSETLSAKAKTSLEKLGVEVLLGNPVTDCGTDGIKLNNIDIRARTIVWAAGVMASPAAKWLNAEHDRAGRVIVDADFRVPGLSNVFVIGDTAAATDATGKPLPGIAPAAKQAGRYVGDKILWEILGFENEKSFSYRDYGNLATIGRKYAVLEMGRLRRSGFLAWLIWSLAHVYFLIGLRSRLFVALNWMWSYMTFERGARLITGSEDLVSSTGYALQDQEALRRAS